MSFSSSLHSITRTYLKGSSMTKAHSSLQHPQTYCMQKHNKRLVTKNCNTYIVRHFHEISKSFQSIEPDSVKATLLQQGLPVHDGYTCIATHCKAHKENVIFVNKMTG